MSLLNALVIYLRRRKKKGGGGWAILMAGGMMGALGIGSLALLAGKALMVSLMALMLSGLVALRKGGGGGGDHDAATYEVINVPTGHGHHRRTFSPFGYSRSLETGFDLPSRHEGDITATDLAYRAHVEGLQKTGSTL
ncbi:hypothetical protein J6590_000862 [Homalodisca vitripennis]|nr:hypothetical protein J6590_000862 [Homalodisca vitripennis]